MTEPTNHTLTLLHHVASHLSGKGVFKHMIYRVTIFPNMVVTIEPDTYVYPSRYKKKSIDIEWLIDHIRIHHMSDILSLDGEKTIAQPNTLVPGEYMYMFSFSGKRRTWVKVKSL